MAEQLRRITLKIFIISLMFLIPGKNFANTGDTTHVQGFHFLLHQNCNQGDSTYLFPPDAMSFYKILLRYELSCPGGPGGCDIYDRIARLKVRKDTVDYEIARAITPYGEGVVLWFDVSDYRMLLHDSVELTSNVCGYSNAWHVSTDFYFIEGTPPMHVYRLDNLWNGTFSYGNTADPIDSHLQPITLIVDSQSVYEKIRLITTGHGFGCSPNQNVAEFSNFTHSLKINGTTRQQHLWRDDCGRNPLYPQGAPGYTSTWFYERANWCPGSYVKPHDYNATPYVGANDSLTVDYNMYPYTVSSCPTGAYHPEYYIQSQAMFYDAINYTNNATIYEVRRPNGAFEFNRMNPGCSAYQPEIVIKNYGGDTLKQVDIHYGVDGNYSGTYHWTGNLLLTDTTTVHLPSILFGPGNHTFDIYTDQPNSSADEFTYDDTVHVNFAATNIYNTNYVVVKMKTDNYPAQSSWKLRNDQDSIIFQRLTFSTGNIVYTDTVVLANGCYKITVTDAGGDGVCCYSGQGYFWVYRGGSPNPIYSTGDYGDWFSANFTIDFQSGVSELSSKSFVSVYPNPANDKININTAFESGNILVSLMDVTGRVVIDPVKCQVIGYNTTMDLNIESSGLYLLKIQKDDNVIVKKIYVEKR